MPVTLRTITLLILATLPAAADLYVAPNGDDGNPGTKEAPLATLEGARDAVRALKRDGLPDGGVTVWLRGGMYERARTFELDERDSGTPNTPIAYRACEGEDVRILGGRSLDPSSATAISDASVRERIVEIAARDKVMQIDLRAAGIEDYGRVRARGFRRPYSPAHMELFVNGEAYHLARWPNDGVVPIGDVLDAGSVPRDGDFSDKGGTFTYGYDRASHWTQADDVFLSGLFGYGFADDTLRVGAIDAEKKTITMAQAHMYGIKTGREWHAYYALNLLEEIDEPGEFYVDSSQGILYFYPTVPLDGAEIIVSVLEDPLVAMEGVSHVTFRDITFEATRGMGVYIERGTQNCIAGCTLRNMGIVAVCIGMGVESDTIYRHEMTGKWVSRELGSWHEHIYENSVYDRHAGTHHGVVGCDIYNIGAGGVHLGGGNRLTLEPGSNVVRNCHIHHFNRLGRSYKAAVNIDGVGNRVEHCLIHDCPNSALYLHGNDHVIEMNEVHHACADADDMGVFYMGRDPSEQGNVIRHNFFHHNGNDHGSTCVVYFDDDACGTAVIGNVFYRNKGRAVWINHGCDHWFDGNVFVDNQGAVQAGQETRAYDWATDELQHKRLRVDLDITKPPYAQRYPQLLETYHTPLGAGRGNYAFRNVSVASGEFEGGTNIVSRNLTVKSDPGFVDMAAMDFTLREDSQVFEQIPGFCAIPFASIGLYTDEHRRRLPLAPPAITPSNARFIDQVAVELHAAREDATIVYTLDGTEPTAESPRYEGPIELTADATVSACALMPGPPPTLSSVVSRAYKRMDARRLSSGKVNFQSADSPCPEGYLADTGAAFMLHDDGSAYGWTGDNTEAARQRGKHDDILLDTLVHFSAGIVWEIAVENGTYDVTACLGDPEYGSTDCSLWAEDTELCNGIDQKANEFQRVTGRVEVNDGMLTLRSKNHPHGPALTKINYVEFAKTD